MIDVTDFREFERDFSLFSIYINDIPIWERLRFEIFRDIREQTGTGQAHTSINANTKDQVKGLALWFKNLFFKNPYLTSESDYLFIGHPRRQNMSDEFWWDLYCDPIHEACSLDTIHFEMPYLLDHLTPAKTESLRYLEFIHYSGTIQRKLGLHDVALEPDTINHLKKVEAEIRRRFSADINLTAKVLRLLQNRECRLWLYKRLIDQVNPKLAVIVVSYGKHLFIEACKQKRVPVVELQHGIIHTNHLGYSFNGERNKTLFPDYLLTWGKFWQKNVEFPVPDNRVIPVGYPHLERSMSKYKHIDSQEQILFISQGTIGEELSKFALEVDENPDIDHDIIYKLHPGEYDRWQEEYPWLVDADFEVVDDSDPPLYKLFAESNVQIGVGSTAIYEGLAFNIETYVYDCSGSNVLDPLIKEGAAELISSVEELSLSLGINNVSFDSDYYFIPNATNQMCKILRQLADEGTPY